MSNEIETCMDRFYLKIYIEILMFQKKYFKRPNLKFNNFKTKSNTLKMSTAILIRSCNIKNPNAPPYILLNKDLTLVGRRNDIDVTMDTSRGKEVSKIHTRIYRKYKDKDDKPYWTMEDNNSLNGTFLNGRKIRSVEIKPHDEIVFGGGPKFVVGERIISTDLAECRYTFFILPPPVHYRADINMTHTNNSILESELLEGKDPELCPICYSPIVGRETLPCGHSFCFSCLKEWGHVCKKRMQPCVCPMCRKIFSYSELSSREYTLTKDELRISFIDPLLNQVGVECCKDIRNNNIFVPWDDNMKQWFYSSYEKVKNSEARKIPFLDLTKATVKYVLKANIKQLSNAIINLNGTQRETKEDKAAEVLMLIFQKFSPPPEARRIAVSQSYYHPYLWWSPFF